MTRLIDADAIPWLVEGVGEIPVITKEEIDQMPTVDAVPVIRCKDCVFNHGGECWGFGDGHLVCDDDYCSGAERK